MIIDRDRARTAFDAYVAAYDPSNPRIALKVEHTYRVAEVAHRIATDLGLDERDVDLAWLCGLLHDMGRFEQVRRWDTFRDADSTSHARLGEIVLFGSREHLGKPIAGSGEPRIRDFVADASEDEVIRIAVCLHSDYRLPAGLDERTRMFCDITRDADKIDILRVASLDTPEAMLGCSMDELLGSTLSPEATRAFDERRCMLRDERSQPADFLVSFVCFAFELAFAPSKKIMREQGCAIGLLEHPFGASGPFHNDHTRAELARMAREMGAYLEEDAS